jgi:AraC family transcriptional regulator of adaptative response/methylated-DNA-[protein]-cysteine methyltransferase
VTIVAEEEGLERLCLLEFHDRPALVRELPALARAFGTQALPGRAALHDEIERQLGAYFAGMLTRFDLPLATPGTEFQRLVWEALRGIPFGETRSYGDLARGVGSPGAQRAVGAANGANRIAIVVPCHRVIESNGALRGYGGGLERKRWLLDHEGALAATTLFPRAPQASTP